MDLAAISGLLPRLNPRQEKVFALFRAGVSAASFGSGNSTEYEVAAQLIAGNLGAAHRTLRQEGLTSSVLRQAAQPSAEFGG